MMKAMRLLPFLAIPLSLGYQRGQSAIRADDAVQTSQVQKTTSIELIPEQEKQVLNDMKVFLKTFTGNEKFNYGTIWRMLEGVVLDYTGIKREARNDPTLSSSDLDAALKYPKNFLGFVNAAVKAKVRSKARAKMVNSLTETGVDPDTEKKPDKVRITKYVTIADLDTYRDNVKIFKAILNRTVTVPDGKKIVFKEGISIEAIDHVLEGKEGLPPGAEIVDIPPKKTATK